MNKKTIFMTLTFLLLVTAAGAASYHERAEDDYYWAKEYYHTKDHYETSKITYRQNTYNEGYRYPTHQEYIRGLYKKRHPWFFSNKEDARHKEHYQEREIYTQPYHYKLRHSPIMNKEYLAKCYITPPRGSIFYMKC